ncbi:MAG: SRPBCC family protein [Nostocoides sp.]
MELSHAFDVPASVVDTWATFMDLERVGGCFPGAQVDSVNEDSFTGSVKVKLGPIALVYAGSGTFIERDDQAHRAVIEASGKDKRGNGTAGATVTVQLTPAGSGTHVDVATDLAITGKPAQFGRGVMQEVSDKLLGQFVACIEGQLGGAGDGPPPGPDEDTAPGQDAAPGQDGTGAGPAMSTASPMRVSAMSTGDDSLDLGRTVLPVIAKSYAPYAVAGLVGFLIGLLLRRRR